MKKIVSVIMICLLLIMIMSGCSSNKTNDTKGDKVSNNDLAKGKYVEEDIEIPSEMNYIISMLISPDGEIELYGSNNFSNFLMYKYIDQEWVKDQSNVLMDAITAKLIYPNKIFYGEDGNLYVLADQYPDYSNELYRLSASGELEKIEVKRFEDKHKEWDIKYRPTKIEILKNGMIAVTYPWRDVEVYSPDGQSTLGEFTCGNSSVMTADNNSLYFIDQNNKEIILINVENNEEQTIIPLAIDLTRNADISYDDGTIYICDVSGIHLKKDGGSIFETILDGNQGSLGMPSYELHDFIPGPQNDYYYVLWKNMDASDVVIKHVYFDENASILPEEELSIFSVEDNRTIRQAISTFRQSHPDININYRVANPNRKRIYTYGLKDPEATVTLQDQINALNTELLSDRGADILIMDELPMDSYIEKGVLEDMSDIFKPMIKNGELLENIAEDFMVNDKIYTMPVRIKLPLIYGNSEAVKAAESMEKLAAYAKDSTDIPLLRESNHRAMTAWFLLLYYNQILNEENEIDEELLIRFLEDVNIVAANIGASDDAPIDWMNSIKGTEMGYWIAGVVNVHKKLTQVNIEELTGFMEFATPIAAAGKWQGTFDVVNNTYRANTLVGLNSAGNNKELAKEFIQHLFSMDIQGAELYDGFPVNTSVLELLILKNNEMGTYSVGDGSYTISAAYPSLENRKLIYEYIKALERPMENDSIMIDMILDEAERYLRGDISVNQAVDNILAGINTYLSE